MSTARKASTPIAHQLARILYWTSLFFLLAGIWALTDPSAHHAGRPVPIYTSLGAFELYMWLLLVLARWQLRNNLTRDAARSAVFATLLSGLLFFILIELHLSAPLQGVVVAIAAVALTAIRLLAAQRWLGLRLPLPFLLLFALWVMALMLPTPIIRSLADNKSSQHLAAYVVCWAVALLMACHIPLVAWQSRQGYVRDPQLFRQWWIPWTSLVILAAVTVIQLYALMWGLFINWAQWYFNPICLAAAVVGLCLSLSCKLKRSAAWFIMALAVFHVLTTCHEQIPSDFPSSWLQGPKGYFVNPFFPNGVFFTLLIAATYLVLRRLWMIAVALIPPAVFALFKSIQAVGTGRHGKGLALLLGAFLLLVTGSLIQWWQQKWGTNPVREPADLAGNNENTKTPVPPEPPSTPPVPRLLTSLPPEKAIPPF